MVDNNVVILLTAVIGIYFILVKNEERWIRITGAFLLILFGVAFGVIADAVYTQLFFLATIAFAVPTLSTDLPGVVTDARGSRNDKW